MGCCKWCCLVFLGVVLVVATSLGLFSAFFPYPSHASCRVDWVFGKDCYTVKERLKDQMELWSSDECSTKQQCRYKVGEVTGDTLSGTHTTPVMAFEDRLKFTLTDSSGGACQVKAFSESAATYAVIDFGTNYCNLRNLVIGSKLDENDSQYKENSTNSVCTMYSIAHCNLYT